MWRKTTFYISKQKSIQKTITKHDIVIISFDSTQLFHQANGHNKSISAHDLV